MAADLLYRWYREVWCVDYEFRAPAGERPAPVCLVARELRTRRVLRAWADEFSHLPSPPYPVGPDVLFVAYYAPAELSCHLALRWPLPARVLDLYAEFRCLTSGLPTPCGSGLLGALAYHGLGGIGADEKTSMRDLILRGGDHTPDERRAILDYCQSDVDALAALLPAMLAKIDLPRALFRGRYLNAVARMEHRGVPIDVGTLAVLRTNWASIQSRLIEKIDAGFGVYEGRTFKADRWAAWLASAGIPWPRLPSGSLALDDDTFREMARAYPAVAPMRELRAVALGAGQSTDTVRFVNTEEGYDVLLFPADDDGNTTLRFVGAVPRAPFGLLAGDSSVKFIKAIDKHGYAVVRDEDIRPVRAGVAELHVQVE